ncbi:MAG TPA: glycosyltransferase family 2 protein [Candidatus Melainabacteria bacterium]|jgi:glycosyltransferase involved in cell wall biosynthesis|nr:glycosyltransferase family 2 protein [Candidatus Melainabacteria bacterium]HIN63877.1 glycosyltransferase family 2 protein [Candidatus Obscuribacterales bacterium]
MATLSVVIVAKNEERIIGRTLDAVRDIADEILVVDSGSEDKTIKIAAEKGARVVHQDWLGYAGQKNFALSLAKSDWLLSLDADEILTPEAVAEIKAIVAGETAGKCDGYKIPRILYIGEHPVRHGGFYPDAQLRLIQNGKGKFRDRMVHERIFVDGPVGVLRHPMLHYSYRNVDEFTKAMDKYARLSAEEFKQDGSKKWRANPVNEVLHPMWTFFARYILRLGFLDGKLGLELNLIYSNYVRNKIRYLRES